MKNNQMRAFLAAAALLLCLPGCRAASTTEIGRFAAEETDYAQTETVSAMPGDFGREETLPPVLLPAATIPEDVPAGTIPAESKHAEDSHPTAPAQPDTGVQQPDATEPIPIPTAPPDPEPTSPAPAPTEPMCCHDWQMLVHEEAGHYEPHNACGCGYRFDSVAEYEAHLLAYAGTAELVTVHGHWGTVYDWIVDTPASCSWFCTRCGAVSNEQP